MTSGLKKRVASIGIATALTLLQGSAFAGPPDDTKSGAAWWQWALSIPASVNPMLDTTGAKCMVGQNGDVWYLAELFFVGGSVTRDCEVPEGVTLFFPVINFVNVDTPNVCGQGGPIPVKQLRDAAAAYIDGAANLSVRVDGASAKKKIRRIKSDVFAAALPDDNVFNAFCGGPGSVPAAVYAPAIDDGYYAEVTGLKPGTHVVQIHAEHPADSTTLDATYVLDVVAVPKH